jgi:hypothetical protein
MKFAKLVLLSAIVGLTACKKSKKDEDTFHGAGGLCTSGVVHAFNYINTYSTGLSTRSDWQLKEVQTQCTNLRNEMGSASCKAVNTLTGADIWVSYSRAATDCANVSAQITANSKPAAPATPSAPAPASEFRSGDACTQEMIDLSNALNFDSYRASRKPEAELQVLSDKCAKFKELMESGYCVASNLATGKTETVAYYYKSSVCTSVDRALQDKKASKDADAAPVKNAINGLYFTVRNGAVLRNAIKNDSFFINGDNTSNDLKQNRCLFMGTDGTFPIQGVTFNWNVKNSIGGYLSLELENGSMMLSCDKASGDYTPWTMAELRKSLQGLIDIQAR